MTDRRTEILDGALHVLAGNGMRGLTHRAVDTAAGLPAGSTSYYFRTRAALVSGCVRRLVELDLAVEVPAAQRAATGTDAFAEVLARIGVAMATGERDRTLARYELTLAAARDPGLRSELGAGGDAIRRRGAMMLAALGASDPEAAAAEVAAVLDGLVLTALVRGPFEPAALLTALRPALARVLRAQPGIPGA